MLMAELLCCAHGRVGKGAILDVSRALLSTLACGVLV